MLCYNYCMCVEMPGDGSAGATTTLSDASVGTRPKLA